MGAAYRRFRMIYTLIDGVRRNSEHPDTFKIPSLEERQATKTGDYVKVGFEYKGKDVGGERMWVEVTEVEARPGQLVGTLANDPVVITELEYGDEIQFELQHVISIIAVQSVDHVPTKGAA